MFQPRSDGRAFGGLVGIERLLHGGIGLLLLLEIRVVGEEFGKMLVGRVVFLLLLGIAPSNQRIRHELALILRGVIDIVEVVGGCCVVDECGHVKKLSVRGFAE